MNSLGRRIRQINYCSSIFLIKLNPPREKVFWNEERLLWRWPFLSQLSQWKKSGGPPGALQGARPLTPQDRTPHWQLRQEFLFAFKKCHQNEMTTRFVLNKQQYIKTCTWKKTTINRCWINQSDKECKFMQAFYIYDKTLGNLGVISHSPPSPKQRN